MNPYGVSTKTSPSPLALAVECAMDAQRMRLDSICADVDVLRAEGIGWGAALRMALWAHGVREEASHGAMD